MKKRMHNKRLRVLFVIFTVVAILSAMALDIESNIPFFVCKICCMWIFLFTWINLDYIEKRGIF